MQYVALLLAAAVLLAIQETWTKCPTGKYGANCLVKCPPMCFKNECHEVNGNCVQGCEAGVRGERCLERCPAGTFGRGCTSKCGQCKGGDSMCGPASGECMNLCQSGYDGDRCDQKCGERTYGEYCLSHCSKNCDGNGTCNHVSGSCDEGCKVGYALPLCEKTCESGTFGQGCNETCSENCAGPSTCDTVNGTCKEGCAPGYTMPMCRDTCEMGTYGLDCKKMCVFCSVSADTRKHMCSPTDGSCTQGCAPGYTGFNCRNKEVPEDETFMFFIWVVVLYAILALVALAYRKFQAHVEQGAEEDGNGDEGMKPLVSQSNRGAPTASKEAVGTYPSVSSEKDEIVPVG